MLLNLSQNLYKMTLSFSFNFDNADDLLKFLTVLKERGFDRFIKKTKSKKIAASKSRTWNHMGIGKMGGAMDTVNIRDFPFL